MLHTTLNMLTERQIDIWSYRKLLNNLGGIGFGRDIPIPLLSIVDSNGIDDALWCLCATIEPADALSQDLACDFVDDVKHLMTDQRSRDAVGVARKHARGLATAEELAAAWTASDLAASHAARAAREAARGAREVRATREAAVAASWTVAPTAAVATARKAAWHAAWAEALTSPMWEEDRDDTKLSVWAAQADRFRMRLTAHHPEKNPLGEITGTVLVAVRNGAAGTLPAEDIASSLAEGVA